MELDLIQKNNSLSKNKFFYPITTISDYNIHMGPVFYGVKKFDNISSELNNLFEINTNIDFIQLILLIFRGDRSTYQKNQELTIWELSVYDYINMNYSTKHLDIQVNIILIIHIGLKRKNAIFLLYF